MATIGRFPPFGKRFFRRIRKFLGAGHFGHFWRLALAIAAMPGRRSIARMRALHRDYRTRQAIAHFLNHADWDAPDLLRRKALDTLQQLGFRPGDTLYFILDDTQQRRWNCCSRCRSSIWGWATTKSCGTGVWSATYTL